MYVAGYRQVIWSYPLLHCTLTCLGWCECVGPRIGLSVGWLAAPITERSRVQTLAAVSRGGERDNIHQGQESGLLSVFILSQATEMMRWMSKTEGACVSIWESLNGAHTYLTFIGNGLFSQFVINGGCLATSVILFITLPLNFCLQFHMWMI